MSRGLSSLVVVDASIAAKWYLPEDLSKEAEDLLVSAYRGETRLVAPSLLGPELGNVFWQRHRRGDISLDRLREAWAAFEAAPLGLVETAGLMPAALEVAVACRCTVYDALYVALAEACREEGTIVLTADRCLISRLAGTVFAGRARALEGA